jgi:hypothetical protein
MKKLGRVETRGYPVLILSFEIEKASKLAFCFVLNSFVVEK